MTLRSRLHAVDTALAFLIDAVGTVSFLSLVGYLLFRLLAGTPMSRIDVLAATVFLLSGWVFSGLSLIDRVLRLVLPGPAASTRRLQELGQIVLVWGTTIAGVYAAFSSHPRAQWIYVWSATSAGLHIGADLASWWPESDEDGESPTKNALAFALASLLPVGHAWIGGRTSRDVVLFSWAQLAALNLVVSLISVAGPSCPLTRIPTRVAHWPQLLAAMQMGMTLVRVITD
jgi:hypothetical protein